MNRRAFLRLLALGVAGHNLDIDRLLWIPGEKKIFLPSEGLSYSQILDAEMRRIIPKLATIFDRDDVFYTLLTKRDNIGVSNK
jgi:hypothetical protein